MRDLGENGRIRRWSAYEISARQARGCHGNSIGVESRIGVREPEVTLQHEPTRDREHERESRLEYDERVTHGVAAALGTAAAVRVERCDQITARHGERRSEAGEQCYEDHDARREGEGRRIDVDVAESRNALRPRGDECVRCKCRERDPAAAAQRTEYKRLRKQQGDDPAYARSDGGANRQFVTPRRRTREQQIGDVRAGDQQEEQDARANEPKCRSNIAEERVAHRPKCEVALVFVCGIGTVEFGVDALQVGEGGGDADARK